MRLGESPRPGHYFPPFEDYLRGEIFICVCVDVGGLFHEKPTDRPTDDLSWLTHWEWTAESVGFQITHTHCNPLWWLFYFLLFSGKEKRNALLVFSDRKGEWDHKSMWDSASSSTSCCCCRLLLLLLLNVVLRAPPCCTLPQHCWVWILLWINSWESALQTKWSF